jgi:hypothetical protein
MKFARFALALTLFSVLCFAQKQESAFADTTYTFGLTPITFPGVGTTLAGAESDILVSFTPNNAAGPSTLISNVTFVGGRYDRTFPAVANWIQNHTALTGYNYQFYATGSLGVVKAATNHWGERAGLGLRWAPAGSTSFSVAFEAQANILPGITDTVPGKSHWMPSIVVSPQFRF